MLTAKTGSEDPVQKTIVHGHHRGKTQIKLTEQLDERLACAQGIAYYLESQGSVVSTCRYTQHSLK